MPKLTNLQIKNVQALIAMAKNIDPQLYNSDGFDIADGADGADRRGCILHHAFIHKALPTRLYNHMKSFARKNRCSSEMFHSDPMFTKLLSASFWDGALTWFREPPANLDDAIAEMVERLPVIAATPESANESPNCPASGDWTTEVANTIKYNADGTVTLRETTTVSATMSIDALVQYMKARGKGDADR